MLHEIGGMSKNSTVKISSLIGKFGGFLGFVGKFEVHRKKNSTVTFLFLTSIFLNFPMRRQREELKEKSLITIK